MNGMFDDSDKEWLDLKFGAVITQMKETTVKNTTDIVVIEKKVDKLVDFKDDHEKHHEAKEKNMKFNLEMWVIVGIFLFDKIFQYVDRFFPPSP